MTEMDKGEISKDNKTIQFKLIMAESDMEEEENLQDIYNTKIRREDDGIGKKDLNKEEMEYGSCCDSSHDGENSILHNFR